jgi:hypothetical protein
LFDFALNAVIPDEGTTAGASASGGSSQEPGADRG